MAVLLAKVREERVTSAAGIVRFGQRKTVAYKVTRIDADCNITTGPKVRVSVINNS